ncbi:low molecular weight phosphotyrosine protein phosphatase [Lasius niger]|uniref:protein-tyrosine-phosphatase n=1 Tax=Lasius niger TaxID=67767 RepID=A0A0J7KLK0_LASNI|nr:low molecular weight phosphotyrosine protein phosphatase [Lasius niger]
MGLSDFWEVESAAILNYHVGNAPEPRAMSTLQKEGIMNYSHVARQDTGTAGFEKAFQQALRSVRSFLEINKKIVPKARNNDAMGR